MTRRTDPALLLRPQEQRIAFGLAAAAALAFVVLWTPWHGGSRTSLFAIGLLFAASLALVARRGHRLWTAFSSFLVGVFAPWGFAYVFGAFFVAFAFWLAWRAHRSVKSSVEMVNVATPLPAKKSKPIESGRVTPKKKSPKRS